MILYFSRRTRQIDIFEFPIWLSLNAYFQVVFNIWILQRDTKFFSPWLQSGYRQIAPITILLIGVGITSFVGFLYICL